MSYKSERVIPLPSRCAPLRTPIIGESKHNERRAREPIFMQAIDMCIDDGNWQQLQDTSSCLWGTES